MTSLQIPEVTAELLRQAVEEQGLPGAALGVVNRSGQRDTLTLGVAQLSPEKVPLCSNAEPSSSGSSHSEPNHSELAEFWWDLASLTKPLFTARTVLQAAQAGLLDLDDAVSQFLPELGWMQETPLKSCTLRQLMTHTAGLPAWLPLYTWGNTDTIRARLMQEAYAMQPPGSVVYSDLGYILLGCVLERIYSRPLRDFKLDEGLTFAPDPVRSVATEHCTWRGRLLRGEAHDENAAALGGVAGHAGLFGTLTGVLNQADLLLNGGWLGGAAQAAATRPQNSQRTLVFVRSGVGWSGGSLASPSAFGHTGFTGTGLWVDPECGLAWVLLTNRVHPSRHTSIDIQDLRRKVANTLLTNMR